MSIKAGDDLRVFVFGEGARNRCPHASLHTDPQRDFRYRLTVWRLEDHKRIKLASRAVERLHLGAQALDFLLDGRAARRPLLDRADALVCEISVYDKRWHGSSLRLVGDV